MRFLRRTTLALSLLAGILVPAQIAEADGDDQSQPLLAQRAHGRAAINALGDKVDEAAAVNGMSVRGFTGAVLDDPTLWVDRHGRLRYADTVAAEAAPAPEVLSAAAALPDTFLLHSRPGSERTIYLDFDGVTLGAGSWWVEDGMAAGPFDGFSLDGDPGFSDAEKTFVQQIWRVVSEKYSPFQVDVTTEAPSAAALDRTAPGDTAYGVRVAFSSDPDARSQACNNTCAGTAYIKSFNVQDTGESEPAWAFTSVTSGSANLTANVAAHEIGHTLGLTHDDSTATPTDYYNGHNHWVPVMGQSNSRAMAQFSKGEYDFATRNATIQPDPDDFATMAVYGAPLRDDDAGDTPGTATPLTSATNFTATGVISTRDDQDVFAISRACTDPLVTSAIGIGTGSTLDIKLTVYDAAEAVVGSNDPASAQNGPYTASGIRADYTVPSPSAATYYLEVDGVGSGGLGGTPDPTTGYTDYGSVGQYTLTATCTDGTTPPSAPQNLAATPTARSTSGSVQWSPPATTGTGELTGYTVTGLPGGTVQVGAATTSVASTALNPGTTYTVGVVATTTDGTSPEVTTTLRIATWLPTAAPSVGATLNHDDATVTWGALANPGNATITGWSTVLAKNGTPVVTETVPVGSPRSRTYTDLPSGAYTVGVTVLGTADDTAGTTPGTTGFTVPTKPSAPKIGAPSFGTKGGAITAVARWGAPASNGGSPVTGYKVIAYKLTAAGNIAKAYYSSVRPSSARAYTWTTLPAGRYKFRVVAINAFGTSPYSAYSTNVLAQ